MKAQEIVAITASGQFKTFGDLSVGDWYVNGHGLVDDSNNKKPYLQFVEDGDGNQFFIEQGQGRQYPAPSVGVPVTELINVKLTAE